MKKMKTIKKITVLLMLFIGFFAMAQVKIGNNPTTINPSALLEAESTTKGFLPPRVTEAQMADIANPAIGLMVYCTDCVPECYFAYQTTGWKSVGCQDKQTVEVECVNSGFQGAFTSGENNSGRSFKVTIKNNSFSDVTLNFNQNDLSLANVDGMTVGTPTGSPALNGSGNITLIAGASVTVTYPITGAPVSGGTLTGNWTKLVLNCTASVFVGLRFDSAGVTQSALTSGSGSANSLLYMVNGETYTQTITVPYTGGDGSAYPAVSVTNQGLTLTKSAGTYANGAGTVTYQLSGTYTGPSGPHWVTFTVPDGNIPIQINAYRVSASLPRSGSISMDGIVARATLSGNAHLQLSSNKGNIPVNGMVYGLYSTSDQWAGRVNTSVNTTLNSSFFSPVSSWSFTTQGDKNIYYIKNQNTGYWYRIMWYVAPGYINNLVSIERLDIDVPGVMKGASVNLSVPVTMDNLKVQRSATGKVQFAAQAGTVAGAERYTLHQFGTDWYEGDYSTSQSFSTTFSDVNGFGSTAATGYYIQHFFRDVATSKYYQVTTVNGSSGTNCLILIENLTAETLKSKGAVVANRGEGLTFEGLSITNGTSGNKTSFLASTTSRSIAGGNFHPYGNNASRYRAKAYFTYSITTTPLRLTGTTWYIGQDALLFSYFLDSATNRWYEIINHGNGTNGSNFNVRGY